jgi:hypothetical protein
MVLGKLMFTCRRLKLNNYFSSYKKLNSKFIRYFNVRPEILKLLQENRKNIGRYAHRQGLLSRTPVVQEIKATIDKYDCIKSESLYNQRK